jgi:hypothetical protein
MRNKRIETIKFSDFMSGEYKEGRKHKKTPRKANKKVIATGSLIPFALLTPKAFAAESVNQCGESIAVSPSIEAMPVGLITDGMKEGASAAGKAVGGEIIAAMATLFDPLISILVSISFPVASVMIIWKIFMSYFRDSGDTWEGIGKICITHLLIQMSPIFLKILKQLSVLAVGA